MERSSARAPGPYPIILLSLVVLCLLALRSWHIKAPSPQRLVSAGADASRSTSSDGHSADAERRLPAARHHSLNTNSSEQSTEDAAKVVDKPPGTEPPTGLWAGDPQPLDVALLDRLAVPRVVLSSAPPVRDDVAVHVAIPVPPEAGVEERTTYSPRVAARERLVPRVPHARSIPEPPRSPAVPSEQRAAWPRAIALRELLVALEQTPAAEWARNVQHELDHLETLPEIGSEEAKRVVDRLAEAVRQAPQPADLGDPVQRAWFGQAKRAAYALERRVVLWQHVVRGVQEAPTWRVSFVPSSVAYELRQVNRLLPDEGYGRQWRQYLLLDELEKLANAPDAEPLARQALAHRVLTRMSSDRLTEEQRWFVAQPALARLNEQLRQWAYEPPDYAGFLEQLEAWETQDTVDGQALVEHWQVLAHSPWEQCTRLAQAFDSHYRNANIRVAISGELINRLLPPVQAIEEDVDDHILGTPVVGRSRTVTRLFVELIPDRMRWRLGLEARGQVQSHTWAERGSISLLTHGSTRYRARKLLTIDRRGIFAHHTETEAENRAELADVSTGLDGLPLIGSLLRSIARRTHRERLPEANAEVEQKVSSRVAQRLDEEIAQRIYQIEKQYRERFLSPLSRLNLCLTALDMQTTSHRLIARYRLAADHQLAAHTPRPIAPSDSLLSVQIHESAINNVIQQLKLEDRRVKLSDLYREITAVFGKQLDPPEDLPDNIVVHFAAVQPVRVRFRNDRVELTMQFSELRSGRSSWYDFQVHTALRPQVTDRAVELVRDDIIELRGPLSFQDRLPLRAIFTALLARERTISLLDPKITRHERLKDTHVSQLIAVDGWLGIAISPLPQVAQPKAPVRVSLSDEPAGVERRIFPWRR